jgi:anti-anti-sigma regulatory factor
MKGAVIMAGLGCPHGCEFCATSHFFDRRHIPLLKTGTDLYREIRRVHKILGDPKLPIGIIEEDFLMQRKRAKEYLDRIKKDSGGPIKISCFASAYSISKWDPEDLVRMGVEALWIGVESREADYHKLKGLDMKKIIDTLHSHGINTLCSLIIGHDFHTVERVWDDFEYLMSLNPSLSQFLILSPACQTPLFDRLKKEGRLLDVPHTHWDGFHLVFDHPYISKEEMEQLILEVYDEEYRRLGPSIIRYVEKQLTGYLKFKNSSDPLLRMRAEQYRDGCLDVLPVFPTAVRYAPTKEVAEKIRTIQQSIVREIGSGGLKNKILTGIVPVFALVENFRLKCFAYPQTRLQRTKYRMSPPTPLPADHPEECILRIKPRPQPAGQQHLIVDLNGVIDKTTVTELNKKVEAHLDNHSGSIAINFSGVTWTEREALLMFFKKLRVYKERIKIVSIDSLKTDMADVVKYARNYFEVFIDVEKLAESVA